MPRSSNAAVNREGAFEHPHLLLCNALISGAGNIDKPRLIGDFDQREVVRLCNFAHVGGRMVDVAPDCQRQRRHARVRHRLYIAPLIVGVLRQVDRGGQYEFAAVQPLRRVGNAGHMHPCDLTV